MPINELEKHPYIDYIDRKLDKQTQYTGLIIGSFPVYACTDSINDKLEIVTERFCSKDVKMRFFYASRESRFWKYCSQAFETDDPSESEDEPQTKIEKIIEFLNSKGLIITDVIAQTNRKEYGDEDSNLWIEEGVSDNIRNGLKKNVKIIEMLCQNKSIENLFFTATSESGKSPFGWFKSFFDTNFEFKKSGNIHSCYFRNDPQREFKIFLLPTPKPRGIHYTDNSKNSKFDTYLKEKDFSFHEALNGKSKSQRTRSDEEVLSEYRNCFIIETYKQAFVHKNQTFDGSTKTPAAKTR